ncbi:MAG TPA: hypothetical protein VLJ37_06555 [bacterium]|nr:hypothetical protein [bacterium]
MEDFFERKGGKIAVNLGTMADGDSAEITIVVSLIDAGDVTNTATVAVAGQAIDEVATNNAAAVTVTSPSGGGGCQLVR